MTGTFFQIIMSAKMASTLAVKSVVTLQVATIALADQGTILMATLERAKVCATCHEDQGRTRIFQRGGHRQGHHPGIADYIWFIRLLSLVYQRAQLYHRGMKAYIN